MPRPPYISFPPDPTLQAAIQECLERYDVGDPGAEWPNNILSTKAVIYTSGRIARKGEPVTHQVDPDELDLIKRLAHDALKVVAGVSVGMGSSASDPFREFYSAANMNEEHPEKIDEALIRARFGGTIFPPATISVEPFAESGTWWSEVVADGEGDGKYLYPWRNVIHWFRTQPDFVDAAFVRIGDSELLAQLDDSDCPPGTKLPGCVLPRLALGLTKQGSLAGLFGYSVQG
ncbi:MAG TPA: hypothetical protein VL475_09245 [Planctomycetaceae bacterium]|nr:hypothetical protein [Planctomycetaceae bacterium]